MNKNLKDMLSASMNDDLDSFKTSFEAEVSDRISSKIAQKHFEVADKIMKDDVDESYSRKAKTNMYNFKSTSDAKKFIKSVMKAGVGKNNLKVSGSKVTVRDLDDGDMGEVIYFMAKDMQATDESFNVENEEKINKLLEKLDSDTQKLLLNELNDEEIYEEILKIAEEVSNDIN